MRYATLGVAFFLVLSLPRGAAQDAAPDDPETKQVSLDEYKRELARIDAQLKMLPEHPELAGSLRSSIPEAWELKTPSRSFEIENSDLREKLERYAESTPQR